MLVKMSSDVLLLSFKLEIFFLIDIVIIVFSVRVVIVDIVYLMEKFII